MVVSKSKLVCKTCSRMFVYTTCFKKHVVDCKSFKTGLIAKTIKKTKKIQHISKNNLVFESISKNKTWIPEFSFTDDFFDYDIIQEIIPSGVDYLEQLIKFTSNNSDELKVLHLNINSVFMKIDCIHDILNSNSYDIIFLNETKLDSTVPDSHVSHKKYSLHRRDRDYKGEGLGRHGGGLLIFIRKIYTHSVEICCHMEAMLLRLTYNKISSNFICCYKSPSLNSADFIEFLDAKISSIDLSEPIFIIGDLNMNLKSNLGLPLKNFMISYKFSNFVNEATRIATRHLKKNGKHLCSSTLIDVLIHNKDLITKTEVADCPFSDHKFILGSLKLEKNKQNEHLSFSRNFSEKNLKLIGSKLQKLDLSNMDQLNNCDDKWKFLKKSFMTVIDRVSPLKKVTIKEEIKCPWFDPELTKAKSTRNSSYASFVESGTDQSWNLYKDARKNFQYLNRVKMKKYFEDKGIKDFKNSKKFWQFYKSSVKLRSDKSSDCPNLIVHDNNHVSEPVEIASIFNNFFTSIDSVSLSNKDDSVKFIETHFNSLIKNNILTTSKSGFSFRRVSESEVGVLFEELLASSSPGISDLHPNLLPKNTYYSANIIKNLN